MPQDTEIAAEAEAVAPETAAEDAGASLAEDAGAQPETDGSASSAEAVDDRSVAEKARDDFLKRYGEEEAPPKAAEPAPAAEEPTERSEGATAGKTRLTDDEFKALTPRAQARIRELSAELRDAKAAGAEVDGYRDDAGAMRRLREWTDKQGLAAEEVSTGLAAMADFKAGRFSKFAEAVRPLLAVAEQALGLSYAPDLQSQVDNGDMTPEAAKELTKARQAAALAGQTAQRERERNEATTQAEQQRQHAASLEAALRQTTIELLAEDPDYAQKQPAIRATLKALFDRGAYPRDAADAKKLLREIHANVAIPKPAPLRPTAPVPTASTVTRPTQPPRNSLEALTRAAEGWGEPR